MNIACNDKNQPTFWKVLKGNKQKSTSAISTHDWFDYFSNLYNIDSLTEEPTFEANRQNVSDDLLDLPITRTEVFSAIKNLKNDKSPGNDGIPAELFKVVSDKFVPYLEVLYLVRFLHQSKTEVECTTWNIRGRASRDSLDVFTIDNIICLQTIVTKYLRH